MEISGLNKYIQSDASYKKTGRDAFRNEVLNWKFRIIQKINEDSKNDSTINMSEKKWDSIMKKVENVLSDQTVELSRKNESNSQHETANFYQEDYWRVRQTAMHRNWIALNHSQIEPSEL